MLTDGHFSQWTVNNSCSGYLSWIDKMASIYILSHLWTCPKSSSQPHQTFIPYPIFLLLLPNRKYQILSIEIESKHELIFSSKSTITMKKFMRKDVWCVNDKESVKIYSNREKLLIQSTKQVLSIHIDNICLASKHCQVKVTANGRTDTQGCCLLSACNLTQVQLLRRFMLWMSCIQNIYQTSSSWRLKHFLQSKNSFILKTMVHWKCISNLSFHIIILFWMIWTHRNFYYKEV